MEPCRICYYYKTENARPLKDFDCFKFQVAFIMFMYSHIIFFMPSLKHKYVCKCHVENNYGGIVRVACTKFVREMKL